MLIANCSKPHYSYLQCNTAQLDAVSAALSKLQHEHDKLTADYKELQVRHEDLQTLHENTIKEYTASKKKLFEREKRLKAREMSMTNREANQNEKDEDNVLLKKRVNELVATVTDMEAQNKDLKLKLLCTSNTAGTSTTCPAPPQNHHKDAMSSLTTVLQTSLLIAATNMIASSSQQKTSPAPTATKITNVYQQSPPHPPRRGYYYGRNQMVYDYEHRRQTEPRLIERRRQPESRLIEPTTQDSQEEPLPTQDPPALLTTPSSASQTQKVTVIPVLTPPETAQTSDTPQDHEKHEETGQGMTESRAKVTSIVPHSQAQGQPKPQGPNQSFLEKGLIPKPPDIQA